jgi:hypothetical protein
MWVVCLLPCLLFHSLVYVFIFIWAKGLARVGISCSSRSIVSRLVFHVICLIRFWFFHGVFIRCVFSFLLPLEYSRVCAIFLIWWICALFLVIEFHPRIVSEEKLSPIHDFLWFKLVFYHCFFEFKKFNVFEASTRLQFCAGGQFWFYLSIVQVIGDAFLLKHALTHHIFARISVIYMQNLQLHSKWKP